MAEDSSYPRTEADENPGKVIWALAGPAVTLNILQTINGFLDTSFLARVEFQGRPDTAALAAVTGSASLLFLFFSVGFALGTAPTAIVARAFGAKDDEEVRIASQKSVAFSIALGVVATLLALLIAPVAPGAFAPAGDPRVGQLMVPYLSIFALALPAMYMVQTIAGCLRAIGDSKSPLYISGIQIFLHIILNFMLIFPPQEWNGITIPGAGWGVVGAAWAMTISAWMSAVVYMIFARTTPLDLRKPSWPEPAWMKRIVRLALPACGMSVLRVGSFAIVLIVLKEVPDAKIAMAAMRVGINIEAVAFMPAFGLMISAQALVGQSLGMKDPERANRLGWLTAHHSAAVVTAVSILLIIFAPAVARLMLEGQPHEVIDIAVRYSYFVLATEIFFSYGMVLSGAMQGAGDMMRPFWMSLIALWIVRVPMAAILAMPAGWGPGLPGIGLGSDGVWWAMTVSQTIQGVLAMWFFKLGAWKHARV